MLRSVVRGVLPLGGTFVRPTGLNTGRTAVRLAQTNIRPLSFQRWVQFSSTYTRNFIEKCYMSTSALSGAFERRGVAGCTVLNGLAYTTPFITVVTVNVKLLVQHICCSLL